MVAAAVPGRESDSAAKCVDEERAVMTDRMVRSVAAAASPLRQSAGSVSGSRT
jgi:hypothetical protein